MKDKAAGKNATIATVPPLEAPEPPPHQSAPPEEPKTLPPLPSPAEKPPPPVPPHNAGDQTKILELMKKVEALELEGHKSRDKLAQFADAKENLEKELTSLKAENVDLKQAQENLSAEKWDLTSANNDLKTKLQQSMAVTYMQVLHYSKYLWTFS